MKGLPRVQRRLYACSEGRLPDDRISVGCFFVPFLLFGSFLKFRVEGSFSNIDNEGRDEERIPDNDVTEEHALLECVDAAGIDGIQSCLCHCCSDHEEGINVGDVAMWC